MANVLILGAGLVTRPAVRYLLNLSDIKVTVVDRELGRAESLINGHPRGAARILQVEDTTKLKETISRSDIVVSLLPYVYHPAVAELCIALQKPMVTASYIGDAMKNLHEKAKKAGILLLNEIGLDPGIDHMSAMRIIHRVRKRDGRVVRFFSYCGGLPAPEANTNPFGYKFSWSPKGVVLAGTHSGRYLKNGKIVDVAGKDLFSHCWNIEIEGVGTLQAYPNRNSLPYIDLYGLKGISSMYRGTLRYPGWCETWKKIADMGLLNSEVKNDLEGLTFREFTAKAIHANVDGIKQTLADSLHLDPRSEIMDRLEWLGLFNDDPIPPGANTYLDVLSGRLFEKLRYEKNERDMIVLHHDFLVEYPRENRKEKITSTLIHFGIPGQDTSMARTVSLPVAIAVRLLLEKRIKETGVQIPVVPSVYEPILDELETLGIVFHEKASVV